MTKKIFRSIFLVALAVLLASAVFIMGVLYEYFGSVQEREMKTELTLAARGVETQGAEYFQELETGESRFTWIGADGSVLFDSVENAEDMENHAQREEFQQALKEGTGESFRYSSTLTEETLYYAKRLSDGTVLRTSVSRMTVLALVLGMLQPIITVLVIALVLSLLLAVGLAKKIVKPLNTLDLESPLENDTYDELTPLLTHIEQQQRQIQLQKSELQKQKGEFSAVVRNMNEGLILLNRQGEILSINPAGAAFLGVDGPWEGEDFVHIERDRHIGRAVDRAGEEGHAETQLSRNGREYQLNISRIGDDRQGTGVVILIFDITDRAFAEQNRREFTANVSHELKTPLQSIMGSAELIENGLAKPEDIPRFAARIRRESARLVALIEDIIRLSRLDEGGELPMESVELYGLAEEEVKELSPLAEDRGVTLSLTGEPVRIRGVRQLLHEVVYNLCDNAVKYNVEGGSVTVSVAPRENGAAVTVTDTGIGIPPEQQGRIFERFYRVDKSHSKETGGTGLGLSIVKHAVQYMKGKITVKSTPGEGTEITVFFPRDSERS